MPAERRTVRTSHAGDVPVELTSFVGRADQIREAFGHLRGARLLTLAGPGGVGKTRLAQSLVAATRRDGRGAQVRWVRLSTMNGSASAATFEREVAACVGVTDVSEHALWQVLVEHLRAQVSDGYLLVLDNCEHVVEQAGAFVNDLLAEVDDITVLATSREALGCVGEQLYLVPPLTYPGEVMELLTERAAAAGLALTERHRASAELLCRRLDGIPLAIELAAAGLRTQSLDEIVEGLKEGDGDARFRLLTGGPRHGARPMHHSLRAAVDWSYQLCSPAEQALWARVSVFSDGWDLDAARAVCGDSGDVAPVLDGLVRKSIVVADNRGRRTRYRLLETLRQYGHGRLVERGEDAELRARHRDHYLAFAEHAARSWYGPREMELLERASAELSNLRAALRWSLVTPGEQTEALAIATSLTRLRVHYFLGILREGLEWLENALAGTTAIPEAAELRPMAMSIAGWNALCLGANQTATALLAQCRAEVTPASRPALLLLEGLDALLTRGDPASVALLVDATEAFGRGGEQLRGERHMALLFAAMATAFYAGEPEALALTQQCLDEGRAVGAEWAVSWAMMVRGAALMRHGRASEALLVEREALRRQREMDDRWGLVWCTHAVAWAFAEVLRARRGADPERDRSDAAYIARVLGGSRSLRERMRVSIVGLTPLAARTEAADALALDTLGPSDHAAATERGAALPDEKIIALALATVEVATEPDQLSRWHELTRTEKEIAVLAARGLTNEQVAGQRHSSVRTVEKHLEHIRRKLAVQSRHDIAGRLPNP
ncbi:ATP-binding protein [Pseudonocardia spinosispora]|uniref:ATP-binding protein n=1 Tax=Pseudonocardia spinosispora TaxID=103441 RepID=UPI00040CF276|nr:LuxR C-terminal-related transcriptional regulator [Pseudonocardia spinosispora]